MTRLLLFQILLLLAPFMVYLAYEGLIGRLVRGREKPLNEAPFRMLFFLGALLTVGGLTYHVLQQDPPSHDGEVFIPPRFEQGERIPGRWITREEAIERGVIAPTFQDGRGSTRDEAEEDPAGDGASRPR